MTQSNISNAFYAFVLLACFIVITDAKAVTMSANTPGLKSAQRSWYYGTSYTGNSVIRARVTILNCSDSNVYTFTGTVTTEGGTNSLERENGTGCVWSGIAPKNGAKSSYKITTSWNLRLKNSTNASFTHRVISEIILVNFGTLSSDTYDVTVPAQSSCSATINDLNIGNLVSGASLSNIRLPFTISGTASSKSLTIGSVAGHIQSDGKLNLGGSSSGVKVYPPSSYISGQNWQAGSSSGSIPLTVDASAGNAGSWSSSMVATLTCS